MQSIRGINMVFAYQFLTLHFEIFTTVKIRIVVFSVITSYDLVNVNQCCEGTCYFHLQATVHSKGSVLLNTVQAPPQN
jgi:hypothetical protein